MSEIARHLHTVLLEGVKALLWRLTFKWQRHPLWSRYLNIRTEGP